MDYVRAYNEMFSMTSFGAHIDEAINDGRSPYVFKISGQIYHWIGSLCPQSGTRPRFLQLYIYDTGTEVENRMAHFGGRDSDQICEAIVRRLIHLLDSHNELVKLFWTARDKCDADEVPTFKIRLFSIVGSKQHSLPTSDAIGAIVPILQPHVEARATLSAIRCHDVGSRTILPASFTGGPRYMYSHYLDALAICHVFGNPQFYVTFTCNVRWPEIAWYLQPFPRLTASDRADIVARVFHFKVKQFVRFLKDDSPLGDLRAVYTIEFQKRGLPHCHRLVWLHSSPSSPISERIDDYISAELPDPRTDLAGYAVISATMMHGPCGIANSRAPCMESSACTKKFPKKYNEKTFFDVDGRAYYQRRNTSVYTTRSGVQLDNSYVVPYNRLLCMTFQAHINVE
ncbi:uncharacterized protein [Rutidosis leptorrhynchoides]|uniref:uncharacterized protein n=1 Tax=Rutidosis leptorrhynchoides TaxID=125765 RepID=UPI003A99ADD8